MEQLKTDCCENNSKNSSINSFSINHQSVNCNSDSEDFKLLECQEKENLQTLQCCLPEVCNTGVEITDCNKQDEDCHKNIEDQDIVKTSTPTPSQPSMTFDCLKMLTGNWSEFHHKKENNYCDEVFLKGCKWSPDGTCLLTNSNDLKMRLFDLPLSLYNCHKLLHVDFPELESSVKIKMGGLVYDFCWYPLMTSDNPNTCGFITTSSRTPVQLWDAYTGMLRCSYRGYNLQDELDAALSLAFHPSGDLLLCGYKDNVKIFNTDIPGRDFFEISTKVHCEQKGIVSCITVNPSMPNIFAAGTYAKSIGLYSMDGHAICLLTGQGGGLTQLIFSQEGSQLISAGRKDSEILCRDLRFLDKVLWVAKRPHTTNQRIYMDLSVDNRYLLSGSSDGHVYVWDLQNPPSTETDPISSVLEPMTKWQAHNDCVNGLSAHRHIPLIATASGQRYIPEIIDDDNADELLVAERSSAKHEDSVKLWWAGKVVLEDC